MPLRNFSQAEVIVTERQRLERPLLVLIWISVCAFSLVEGQWFYLAAATLAVGINLLASLRSKEVYVARLFVNLGVLAATVILIIELFFRDQFELLSLGHYIILILLCKLFEHKNNRDYVQMLLLSLLVMVAAAFMTVELWFGLTLVVYLGLICYTAMIFSLKRGLDAAASAVLSSEAGPLAPKQVAWNVIRDWPGRPLKLKLVSLLAIISVFTICVFLFLPRLPRSAASPIGMTTRNLVRESGFSGTVSLGSPGQVYLSDRELLRVHLSGEGAQRHLGYMRAKTFEEYRGQQWSAIARPTVSVSGLAKMAGASVEQEVWMDPSLAPSLFAAYPAVEFQGDDLQDVRADGDLNWAIGTKDLTSKWLHYKVRSWVPPESKPQLAALRETQGEAVFGRPSDTIETTPRVEAMAHEWCADLLAERARGGGDRDKLDMAIAQRIASRLKRDYTYSLDFSDADPAVDGVEDFLFNMKHGHCEYFASAMTVLCRSLDVRARLAIGFKFDGENRRGSYYSLRGRDAHAWTEVYTHSTGWVVVDATATSSTKARKKTAWWGGILRMWVDLRSRWNDKVIGYDDRSHRATMSNVLEFFVQAGQQAARWAKLLGQSFMNLLVHGDIDVVLARFVVLLAAAATVVEGLLLGRFLRRRREAKREGAAKARGHIEFFVRLQELLERHGVTQEAGQTFREQAHAAAILLDLPEDALQGLVGLYYRVRWGKALPDAAEMKAARAAVDSLDARLREKGS